MTKINNIPFFDHCFDKNRLKKWITKIYLDTTLTEDLTLLNFIEKIKNIGYQEATKAGVSIGIDDLKIPPKKNQLLASIESNIHETTRDFGMNRITALENFQNFIDIWHRASETIKNEVVINFEETDTLNPVYMMAFSGARGNLSQVSQLVGMRGFMSDPEGQIIDYPIRSNFREGLTLTEYVISCYGARKGLVDTALRTADAGYLTRRLVDVAHHVIITKFDCTTKLGVWMSSIQENSKILYPLEKRLVGRVLASNIYFPYTDEETNEPRKIFWSYFRRNQQLDPPRAKLLASFFKKVLIRSPLRCLKKKRLCQLCYGWTLPHGQLAPIGEAVGILAAQSIGEPGTQLTMRTFHTGGVFSGALSDEIRAPYAGIIEYEKSLKGAMFRSVSGKIAFLTKEKGILKIQRLLNNQIEKNSIFELEFPQFSILFFKQGQTVEYDEVFIEFPKQNQTHKETIFNNYTYYSKLSGLLEVYKTTSDASNNDELLTHPKLPKLHPFFEQQKSKNKKFQSLRISAGQIYQTSKFTQLLAKPGDLINRNTLLSLTKLVNVDYKVNLLTSINQTSQDQNEIPVFDSLKNMLNCPLQSAIFNPKFGYKYLINPKNVNNFNPEIIIISPHLNNKTHLPAIYETLSTSTFPLLKNAYFLIPLKNIFKQRKKKQKQEYKPFFLPIGYRKHILVEEKRIKESFQKHLPKQSTFLAYKNAFFNIWFYVIEQNYFTAKLLQTPLLLGNSFENNQIKRKGVTLFPTLDKKGLGLDPNRNFKNQIKTQFVKKQQGKVATKNNFQNNGNFILSPFDGFLKTKILKSQPVLPIQNKRGYTNYWEKQEFNVLKKGWPYFSLKKTNMCKKHRKFYTFGDSLINTLNCPTKPGYSQWLYVNTFSERILTKFQSRTKLFSKNPISYKFTRLPEKSFILLLESTKEYSLFLLRSDRAMKNYNQFFYKNESLHHFKQLVAVNGSFRSSKGEQIQNLFNNLNKTRKTSNRVEEFDSSKIRLELHFFKDNLHLKKLNFLKSPNKLSGLLKPTKPFSLVLKIEANPMFPYAIDKVNGNSFLISKYSRSLTTPLTPQLYFKNQPLKFNHIYIPKLFPDIMGNRDLLQFHFVSPYTGEIVNTESSKLKNPKSSNLLVLTFKDTFTIKTPFEQNQMRIGEVLSYGQKINSTKILPLTGRAIQINSNFIKYQQLETALVSPNSEFFGHHGQLVKKTSRLFTQPYPRLQMGDIVQGIPKIEEFFEARQTKDGEFFSGNLHERLRTRFDFYRKHYRYPIFIATRKSIYEIQNYIIDSIYKLYSSQGISLSDKHLEIIVRRMTSRVKVTDFWLKGTQFIPWRHPLPNELYPQRFMELFLARRQNMEYEHIRYEPVVLGITKAALTTGGFISAASFQETTRILARGAIFQKRDHLKGLKENVILGHIIPAGTAVRTYSRRYGKYKGAVMARKFKQQTLQVLTVNYDWQLNRVPNKTKNTQYFNPVRLVLIRMLLLAYFHVL